MILADADKIKHEPSSAPAIFVTRQYWGGSGSYVDLNISTPTPMSFQTDHVADKQYKALLIELLNEMKLQGITWPGFEYNKKYLERAVKTP